MSDEYVLGKLVSKRLNLTLPDAVFAELEEWADNQGRPTANLAAFLVELGIRQAKEKGEYVPQRKAPLHGKGGDLHD